METEISGDLKNAMTSAVVAMTEHVTDECKAVDVEADYSECLDENYSFEQVGGPFAGMLASRVLKEVDPTAYRCGLGDHSDFLDLVEIGGDSYRREDVETAAEAWMDDKFEAWADGENLTADETEAVRLHCKSFAW